jgi:ABC-type uncharacterized transport system permease subunit
LIPAFLKAYLKVDEIITTLMFNYIAILFYQYLFNIAWKDPAGFGFPGTACCRNSPGCPASPAAALGLLHRHCGGLPGLAHPGPHPLGLRNPADRRKPDGRAVRGHQSGGSILLVMFISGGLAGLAGMSEVSGISHRLQRGLAVGTGFTGIIVAWLARLNPWGVLLVAFLLAALFVGGEQIQMTMGLPASVAPVLQGAILLFVLGGNVFTNYRLRLVRHAPPRLAKRESSGGGITDGHHDLNFDHCHRGRGFAGFATIGEIFTERSGILNLGVEGMMIMGAVTALPPPYHSESAWVGVLVALLAGGAMALIHAFLTISLRADQVVSGLALTLFGTGLSSFLGQRLGAGGTPLVGLIGPRFRPVAGPWPQRYPGRWADAV